MPPPGVEQLRHLSVACEDVVHRGPWGLDPDRQAQRLVRWASVVADPSVVLQHANTAPDVVSQLFTGAKSAGRNGWATMLDLIRLAKTIGAVGIGFRLAKLATAFQVYLHRKA